MKRNGKTKGIEINILFYFVKLIKNLFFSYFIEKIRVGRDYQAVCPPLIPEHERKTECIQDRALLVWSPTKDIPDAKCNSSLSLQR